ncbi:hypothetical protein [Archangium lipolyticum]|uniref:hypothetical protein n=1 Tax=Archangium lipolyticum TaxID=2970465 RepID=UPI00214A4E77|nr:hypothetical protein [Archangium lipolyticum]
MRSATLSEVAPRKTGPAPVPWGSIAGVLIGAFILQTFLTLLGMNNLFQVFIGPTELLELASAKPSLEQASWVILLRGRLLVFAGLVLANFFALLLLIAATVGRQLAWRQLARWAFFIIAALGALWGVGQLYMGALMMTVATCVSIAGSLRAGWLIRESTP